MNLSTFLVLQRSRIETDKTLEQDIRKSRFANAPKRLSEGERDLVVPYHTHNGWYDSIKAGYRALRMLYE